MIGPVQTPATVRFTSKKICKDTLDTVKLSIVVSISSTHRGNHNSGDYTQDDRCNAGGGEHGNRLGLNGAILGGKDSKSAIHSFNEDLISTCFYYSRDRTVNREKKLWPHDMYVLWGEKSGLVGLQASGARPPEAGRGGPEGQCAELRLSFLSMCVEESKHS